MVNTNKIKGRMREKGFTQETVAKIMKLSENSLCKKINGKVPMTVDEAETMAKPELLDIKDHEFGDFFFYHPVAQCNRIDGG